LSARSALEALEIIESQHPDVMLSDIGMPSVDGYALLKQVRGLGAERGGKLPVIALTAFARTEDQSRTANAGFAVHVAKPLEPAKLARTVAEVVGRSIE
jgi:CheY-like chemotaxis protein